MGSSVLCWNALWLTDSWFHSCCTYLKTYLYALYQLLSIEFLLYITEKNLMFQFASHYIHWHILHNSSLVLLFQDTWPQALRTSPLSAGTRLPWDSLTRRGCRGAQCLGLLLGHTRVLETALYLQPDKRYVLTPKRHTQTSWWTLRACRDPVGVQLVGRHLATRPSPRDAAGLQGTASLRSVLQHEWAGPGDQGSVVSWLKTGKALLFLSQRTCTGQQHCSGSCRCLVHLKFRLLLLRRTRGSWGSAQGTTAWRPASGCGKLHCWVLGAATAGCRHGWVHAAHWHCHTPRKEKQEAGGDRYLSPHLQIAWQQPWVGPARLRYVLAEYADKHQGQTPHPEKQNGKTSIAF